MFDDHDDEVMGEPTFELRLADGQPVVSGCYFMHPVLHVAGFDWDDSRQARIVVTADDGSRWFADGVARAGVVNVVLHPIEESEQGAEYLHAIKAELGYGAEHIAELAEQGAVSPGSCSASSCSNGRGET